jgi:hypothetical protein
MSPAACLGMGLERDLPCLSRVSERRASRNGACDRDSPEGHRVLRNTSCDSA